MLNINGNIAYGFVPPAPPRGLLSWQQPEGRIGLSAQTYQRRLSFTRRDKISPVCRSTSNLTLRCCAS